MRYALTIQLKLVYFNLKYRLILTICEDFHDNKGAVKRREVYISRHLDTKFNHGLCPKCIEKPDYSFEFRAYSICFKRLVFLS